MLARASARPRQTGGARRERLTDALLHEPGALTGHAHQAVELIGAQGLSGLTPSPDGEEPLAERNVTVFKRGPDRHGELPPAGLAFQDPLADGRGRARPRMQPVGSARLAVRAHRALRPPEVFQKRPRGILIEKLGSRGRGAGTAIHIARPSVQSGSTQSPRPSELALDPAREALDGLGSRDELAVDQEGGRARHAEAHPLVHALLHRGRMGPAREAALEARQVEPDLL